jgi:uncharacterized membrane protein
MSERGDSFTPIRLGFACYLTLALELQLAADILASPETAGAGDGDPHRV